MSYGSLPKRVSSAYYALKSLVNHWRSGNNTEISDDFIATFQSLLNDTKPNSETEKIQAGIIKALYTLNYNKFRMLIRGSRAESWLLWAGIGSVLYELNIANLLTVTTQDGNYIVSVRVQNQASHPASDQIDENRLHQEMTAKRQNKSNKNNNDDTNNNENKYNVQHSNLNPNQNHGRGRDATRGKKFKRGGGGGRGGGRGGYIIRNNNGRPVYMSNNNFGALEFDSSPTEELDAIGTVDEELYTETDAKSKSEPPTAQNPKPESKSEPSAVQNPKPESKSEPSTAQNSKPEPKTEPSATQNLESEPKSETMPDASNNVVEESNSEEEEEEEEKPKVKKSKTKKSKTKDKKHKKKVVRDSDEEENADIVEATNQVDSEDEQA